MKLESGLIDHMVVNQWVASGCLKRSVGVMVLLISIRQGLWSRVIPKRKMKISLILIHLLPVKLITIRVLLSLFVSRGLLIHQMDVKIAFLNGELEEKIYMTQSDGFIVKG
jgi:hypothetical protein